MTERIRGAAIFRAERLSILPNRASGMAPTIRALPNLNQVLVLTQGSTCRSMIERRPSFAFGASGPPSFATARHLLQCSGTKCRPAERLRETSTHLQTDPGIVVDADTRQACDEMPETTDTSERHANDDFPDTPIRLSSGPLAFARDGGSVHDAIDPSPDSPAAGSRSTGGRRHDRLDRRHVRRTRAGIRLS